MRVIVFSLLLCLCREAHAFLGSEMVPLIELVAGQVQQIEILSRTVGATEDQTRLMKELNEGIDHTVTQIQSLQNIIERAQDLDPKSIRSLSDLNDLISRAKRTKEDLDELMWAKVDIANQAIQSGSLQSDTAYKMGQEMVVTGSQLATQSRDASPGRAAQITASANSAQMLASGIQLQSMAELIQLEALNLEFQKSQAERELKANDLHKEMFTKQLGQTSLRNFRSSHGSRGIRP